MTHKLNRTGLNRPTAKKWNRNSQEQNMTEQDRRKTEESGG